MNNAQIIEEIAMQIFGEEAVLDMLAEGIEIPLHTVQGWAVRGPYRVKKGEHGYECRLWKKRDKKDKDEDMEKSDSDIKNIPSNRDFYMCKSYLFRHDQVEKIET